MNPRNKFAYFSLGKLYHHKRDGNKAIIHFILAEKLFLEVNQTDFANKASANLEEYFKIYNMKPESFVEIIKGKTFSNSLPDSSTTVAR